MPGEEDEERAKKTADLTKEEKESKWLKELGEDPYVKEAIAILAEIPQDASATKAKQTDLTRN
jgi:hypothetical protein